MRGRAVAVRPEDADKFAAARGERYRCFLRPDTRIEMMYMPDAIEAMMFVGICSMRVLNFVTTSL